MDEAFLKKLETRAYYAVVRALGASNKLNFDTEALLMDLQAALGLEDEDAMNLVAQVEGDEEITMLKAYDSNIPKMGTAPSAQLPALQAAKPAARPAAQSYQQESPFSQPAAKKQKKAPGGSLPPPSALARIPSASPAVKQPVAQPASKQKSRALSTAPTGGALVSTGSALVQRNSKAVRPAIGAATFARVMQRGAADEMEAYLTELNIREREIFTELITQGVDEHDPDLNELHRELIRWYKLDQRQATISQQLVASS